MTCYLMGKDVRLCADGPFPSGNRPCLICYPIDQIVAWADEHLENSPRANFQIIFHERICIRLAMASLRRNHYMQNFVSVCVHWTHVQRRSYLSCPDGATLEKVGFDVLWGVEGLGVTCPCPIQRPVHLQSVQAHVHEYYFYRARELARCF